MPFAQLRSGGRVCSGAMDERRRSMRWSQGRAAGAQPGRWSLRGEAGIGKTALLRYLIESASDLTVARAAGVESEMELPFASLHQLSGPMLDRLERLPAPQREALEIVFALSAGAAPDRLLVGLGVLSLALGGCGGRPAAVRRRRRSMA